mmetsp:Transcript_17918/g.32398  ORF Transcript_17918/g.32398 Transcript_17918/m.32398 type:complete len:208 (+) Transcript_17918:6491-7114(+)
MATMDSTCCDNNVKIIPFCVPLPSSSSFTTGEAAPSHNVDSGFGIVGTITLRGQSAVVWFGWGAIEAAGEEGGSSVAKRETNNGVVSVGSGKPPMGSLSLSMPPPIQNTRPRTNYEVPTSQLLGGSSEEDIILGYQISARLAKRLSWPVFVSCSISGWGGDGSGAGGREGMASPALSAGYDDDSQRHAAALAEREVSRIILQEKSIM